MASQEQIAELRVKVSEPDDVEPYTDAVLGAKIDEAGGDTDEVAADIWEQKASRYAEMVDISEAGSSRKNSQLMTNATNLSKFYRQKVIVESGASESSTTPIRRL